MGDYSRVAHNPSGDVYSTPEKDPSSIRGAILRAETEIDVGINRILGLIQAFGSAEGYYHDDFRRDSALALEMAEKIDGKVAEVHIRAKDAPAVDLPFRSGIIRILR